MKFADIKTAAGYEELERVLCAAYIQAAVGKGAERHADSKPFTDQPMQTIAQSYGSVDGMMFQVSKKLGESRGLPDGRAQAEVLGAIVYAAGVHIAYDTWASRRVSDQAGTTDTCDGWIEWKGGECPVNPDDMVNCVLRSGSCIERAPYAGALWWSHNGDGGDIIKYRVVKS
jgi:hypothetical protein